MAGAFCLIGWVALAVFGADTASASEHSPDGPGLGGVLATALGDGSADSAATTEQAGPRGSATGDRSQQPARPAAAAGRDLGSVVDTTLQTTTTATTEPLRPAVEGLAESETAADWDQAAADWDKAVAEWKPPHFDGLDLIRGDGLVPGPESGEAAPAPSTPRPADRPDGVASDAAGVVRAPVADPAPGVDGDTTTPERPDAPVVSAAELPVDGPAAPGGGHWPTGASSTSSSTHTGGSGNGSPLAYGGPVGVYAKHMLLGVARASDDLAPLGDAVKPDVSPD